MTGSPVSVYDAPELTRTVRVVSDGPIRLPILNERIKAPGLYPADIEAAIATALRQEEILVDPFVTVTEGPATLLEAIARAQGLREDAGQEILVSQLQPDADGKSLAQALRHAARRLQSRSAAGTPSSASPMRTVWLALR